MKQQQMFGFNRFQKIDVTWERQLFNIFVLHQWGEMMYILKLRSLVSICNFHFILPDLFRQGCSYYLYNLKKKYYLFIFL